MPHPLLSATLAASAIVLSGCVALTEKPTPPPTLSSTDFHQRMNALEETLLASCDNTRLDTELSSVASRQDLLIGDVREVGSLLRGMNGRLDRLDDNDSGPVVVRRECAADELGIGNKAVLGSSEWIGLPDVGTYLKARIDSGANTSSLSAREITRFERDGENWVRFKLGLADDDVVVEAVRDEWIEAPIERRVRIIQATGEESRPVVTLMMTLGSIREPVEFTLSDRTHLDFPALLGRRFLLDIAVIDVAERYLHPRPEFPGGRPASEAERHENDADLDNETH
ncbi:MULTISPECIES: ATP-dependent zinc protease [unclassified Halomonas]|uniref:ATP-dependent zinc protease family protein n=1 Tax=unclassified Halomonas TaxID=2609666 RepID=UPI002886E40B|nr:MULTISPECIES: ATP-dependent zinc protease [unclassified Halomonas]MDT0499828.1 ATP-dependent zinc protease [Halomonas sp. PAR7]MDT0510355.1 ATP-dependent zinc protease [Halomonas sp. LES1]MDT0589936.1 ATP-dependent zinc protease [Halomonas sp. PAR8]